MSCSCSSFPTCQTNCGCGAANPIPTRLSDIVNPITQLTSVLTLMASSAHTLAPHVLHHVKEEDPAVAPATKQYIVGDVIVAQRYGNTCLYWNRRTGLAVSSTAEHLARFTPLEGEYGRTYITATVNDGVAYEVNCADKGFTSLYVVANQPLFVAGSAADLADATKRTTQPANVPLMVSRVPGEPRIAPIFVKPNGGNISLQIVHSS